MKGEIEDATLRQIEAIRISQDKASAHVVESKGYKDYFEKCKLFSKEKCSAKGKKYLKCKKNNYFASVCRPMGK